MRTVIPSDRIFSSLRKTIMDSFSCILFLPQLHLSLNMHYFINFILIISICSQELTSSTSLNDVDIKMFGGKSNLLSKHQKYILTSCTRVVLHSPCKMTFPSPGGVHGNSGRVCKKSLFNSNAEVIFFSHRLCHTIVGTCVYVELCGYAFLFDFHFRFFMLVFSLHP